MLKLLMFGRTGQVATEIQRMANPQMSVIALGRDMADLGDPEACAATIRTADADVILNAAAYTAVDQAEEEEDLATRINAEAPSAMAQAAATRGLPFLHISTDYVFDGAGTDLLDEKAPTSPLSAYGRSKLAGEQAIVAANGRYAILRTSWIFSAHGRNFVKTMLRLGAEGNELKVVDDQWGNPTAAHDVAEALVTMAKAFSEGRGTNGLFHFGGTPATTWYGFAREIFRQVRKTVDAPEIISIATEDWPTVANRPAYAALDCGQIRQAFGITQPDWSTSLGDVLDELGTLKYNGADQKHHLLPDDSPDL